MPVEIAIIGLGSWGLSALERIVTTVLRSPLRRDVVVHVVEPGLPGTGVHRTEQPDYFLLNNPCGQLSLWAEAGEQGTGDLPYQVGLYDWASQRGYRWEGDRCRIGDGRAITPHDYLPRRVMGEYLNWFYTALLAAAPPELQIITHRTTAVGVSSRPAGEEVRLADGHVLTADHVILTLGHTPNVSNAGPGSAILEPYPTAPYDALPSSSRIGIAGMGLVAIDVVVALTVGRGGRFVEAGDRLRYLPSGHEPMLEMFSRSGLPYCAKAVAAVDQTGAYDPVICTPALLQGLQRSSHGSIDLRTQVMPATFAEMQLRYLSQSVYLADGPRAASEVRTLLGRAWQDETFGAEVARLSVKYGAFDPEEHFLGVPAATYGSSADYQADVYEHLASDLDESLKEGGSSPVKHAYEVWRINRDDLRAVTEYGGLSLASYRDFEANVRSRINRLIAGPPALRSRQLLALMDAGILTAPYGPAPVLEPGLDDGVELQSRVLDHPWSGRVDWVIQGHLEHPTVHRSASPLLIDLYRTGRLQQLRYGDVPVGSVALTEDFHPIDGSGRVEERLWMFGVLTEGVRYFTHYLPSPKSRLRAVQDMGACAEAILA